MIQEGFQVFLHLNRVILDLGRENQVFYFVFETCIFSHLRDGEYPEPALAPSAMLLEQEGEEHEQASVVHDPPDVDVALDKVVIEVDG